MRNAPPTTSTTGRNLANTLIAIAAAFLAGYCLASVGQSLSTLHSVLGMGAELSAGDVAYTILQDLYGLAFKPKLIPYALLVALALALGFATAALIRRRWKLNRAWLYPLAGAAGMGALMVIAHEFFFAEHFFSATRSLGGKLSQVAAGGAGGAVLASLLNRRNGGH